MPIETSRPEAAAAAKLLIIPQGEAKLSRGQRQFNTLMADLQQLREALGLWQPFAEEFRLLVLREVVPEHTKLRTLQRETALWIDAYLARMPVRGPRRLAKGRVRRLVRYMALLARPLLEDGEDTDLEAAFERQVGVPFDETRQGELAMVDAVLREVLREGLSEQTQAPQPASPAEPTKPSNAALKREQAQKQASLSVREIYRRLASALHPDRETDPDARARKTALMQRANLAHERGDLLDLLAMQVELEGIDQPHLARASEERLGHYCKVLREQQASLKTELSACQADLREFAQLVAPKPLPPPDALLTLLTNEAKEIKLARRQLAGDLLRLQDPAQIDWMIDVLPLEALEAQAQGRGPWVTAEWDGEAAATPRRSRKRAA
jgi:hypothetical protein